MSSWIATGATGFLGQKLLKQLHAQKIDTTSYSLRNPEKTKLPVKADVVAHLAGRTGVGRSWDDPLLTYEANVLGTLKALEIAKSTGAFFIFVSTAAYSAHAPRPTTEDSPLSALHPYGHSKALAEDLVRFYGEAHGVKTAILRVFNVYGPGQSEDFLIPRLIAQVLDSSSSEIEVRNTTAERDFVDVDDVVSAMIHVGLGRFSGTFNVASGTATSVHEVLQLVQELTGRQKKISTKEAFGKNEVKFSLADIGKLRATGWSPQVSLKDGIKKMLAAGK